MVLVEGLAGINRSLKLSGIEVSKAMRLGLREAAEPIRQDAGRLSQTKISGMKRAKDKPPPWSIQRVGQNIHEVYIAPKQRGVKSRTDRSRRRPNLATLMLGKAYEPALARNETMLRAKVDAQLTRVVREI